MWPFTKDENKLPSVEFIDNGRTKLSSWKITSGEFSGVVYQVGNVSVPAKNRLKFKFEILKNPTGHDLDNNAKFRRVVGDLLFAEIKKTYDDREYWLRTMENKYGQ